MFEFSSETLALSRSMINQVFHSSLPLAERAGGREFNTTDFRVHDKILLRAREEFKRNAFVANLRR